MHPAADDESQKCANWLEPLPRDGATGVAPLSVDGACCHSLLYSKYLKMRDWVQLVRLSGAIYYITHLLT